MLADARMIATLETNVVALASAGTGKTHGLVGAMLRALLGLSRLGGRVPHPPLDPARLVATTFSRRAAAEMKSRLFAELERLATSPSSSSHLDQLREAALDVRVDLDEPTLARRARAAQGALPRARISTLHALAYDLVRGHATLAGLPPDFTLATEDEERRILETATLRTLAHFEKTEPDLLAALASITGTGEGLADRLLALLAEHEEDGSNALSAPNDDARIVEEQMKRKPASADITDLGELAKDPLLPRVPGGKGNSKKARAEAFHLAHEMRAKLGEVAAGAARVLQHAAGEANDAHARAGKLGFGGVLRAARDLLRDRPEIAAEIARGIDALFVDEFQDTSRVQCEIVTLLWQEKGADFRPSGLYVVGDRKQSIYAFRGADVSVFSRFCVALAGEPARLALGLPSNVPVPPRPTGVLTVLRHNHRSRAELLAFTNAAAPRLLVPASDGAYEARYVEDTERLLAPGASAGEGERDMQGNPAVTWLRWQGGPRKKTVVADEARVVATRIAMLVRAGRAHRDIAVLARTNEMLDAVAHELARLAIPHVVGGHGFFRAREVRDMLAMLTVIVRPLDRRALLEVARGIWGGSSDRSLLALVDPGRGLAPLEEWRARAQAESIDVGDRENLGRLADVVLRLRRTVDRIGPSGALREAMAALDVEAVLARLPRGAQRSANVRKLLGMAEREPNALAFLDRSLETAEGAREAEAAIFSDEDDAIRLMTLHASKGLDFPVVIIPQIGAGAAGVRLPPIALERTDEGPRIVARIPRPGGRTLEPPSFRRAAILRAAREEADRRRLAYVAITRASDEMILVGDRSDPKPGSLNRAVVDILESDDAWTVRVEEIREEATGHGLQAAAQSVRSFAAPPSPRHIIARSLPIATTALADFQHCPRRFQLVHLFELPEAPAVVPREGDASPDARAEGTLAHRVLESVDPSAFGAADPSVEIDRWLDRENAPPGLSRDRVKTRTAAFLRSVYARRIGQQRATIDRERAFVIPLEGLLLKGSIDLVVRWPDGSVDVIDYKRARGPAIEPHAFQLDAYAFAVAKDGVQKVRAGIVFLGGSPEPRFRAAQNEATTKRFLVALAKRLQAARAADRFPRIEKTGCRAIRCGYEALCHPPGGGAQLELF